MTRRTMCKMLCLFLLASALPRFSIAGEIMMLKDRGIHQPQNDAILNDFLTNVFNVEYARNGGAPLSAAHQADFDANNTNALIGCFVNTTGTTTCSPTGTLSSGCNNIAGSGGCS